MAASRKISISFLLLLAVAIRPSATCGQDHLAEIKQLEQKATGEKAKGSFDFGTHNKLRDLYLRIKKPAKSLAQVEIILKNDPLNDYMKLVVVPGKGRDRQKALLSLANQLKRLPNLQASSFFWASELETNLVEKNKLLAMAIKVRGVNPKLIKKIEIEAIAESAFRQDWPAKIKQPRSLANAPGPWSDPDDNTVWPNQESRSNSDPWLSENHDSIRVMRPRVLVINFSNEHDTVHLSTMTEKTIKAIAESSRYHGTSDTKAPAFLQYRVFKFVDLRDKDRTIGDGRAVPIKDPAAKKGFNFAYRHLFSAEFAQHYGVPDPRNKKRMMNLGDLIDAGYIHEVWFFTSGNTTSKPYIGAFEVVEQKPKYDDQLKRIGDEWVQAGNGGDGDQPWVGRSCRIGNINASRGVGCFLESLAHGVEGNSNSNSIPYFRKYFREYADFNLRERYGTPFDSLYAVEYNEQTIKLADQKTAIITHANKEHRVENYIPVGGSAHFPPNARRHYDLDNEQPILCTMADWRIGSGPNGTDRQAVYTADVIKNFRPLAPDCMGAWLIYWRQNMPGLDNKQKDDDGKPMKNWWPFLFY